MARVRGSCRTVAPSRPAENHTSHPISRPVLDGPVSTQQLSSTEQDYSTQKRSSIHHPRADNTTRYAGAAQKSNVLQPASRHKIPNHAIIDVGSSNDETVESFDAYWRHGVPGVEWPPHLSADLPNIPPKRPSRLRQPRMTVRDEVAQHTGGELPVKHLRPARYEANERRRGKKYESDIQAEAWTRRKSLATSVRHNRPPGFGYDSRGLKASSRKNTVPGAGQTSIPATPFYQQDKGFCPPVYLICDPEPDDDVSDIQLDSHFGGKLTSHPLDQFVPVLSIQAQARGVRSRTPDPFPAFLDYPRRKLPIKVKQPGQGSSASMLGAPRFIHLERPQNRNGSVEEISAEANSTREMERYFDFDAACQV